MKSAAYTRISSVLMAWLLGTRESANYLPPLALRAKILHTTSTAYVTSRNSTEDQEVHSRRLSSDHRTNLERRIEGLVSARLSGVGQR